MYTKAETSRIKHDFWTTFGRYMNPVHSAEGKKINWINYHTGVKEVYFRMNADAKSATIAVSIEHSDPKVQELYFEQFLELKTVLHATLEEEWAWCLQEPDGSRVLSRIYKTIVGISILRKDDWHEMISFFKPRIIALDAFWENAKWSFEELK
jgi:hypothetical protein